MCTGDRANSKRALLDNLSELNSQWKIYTKPSLEIIDLEIKGASCFINTVERQLNIRNCNKDLFRIKPPTHQKFGSSVCDEDEPESVNDQSVVSIVELTDTSFTNTYTSLHLNKTIQSQNKNYADSNGMVVSANSNSNSLAYKNVKENQDEELCGTISENNTLEESLDETSILDAELCENRVSIFELSLQNIGKESSEIQTSPIIVGDNALVTERNKNVEVIDIEDSSDTDEMSEKCHPLELENRRLKKKLKKIKSELISTQEDLKHW